MERKLAAILAADVEGFAGLVAQDENRALRMLDRLRSEIIDVQVGAHRGRIFKTLGDGVLAEFSSTVEAVNCAIGIQRAMAHAARSPDSDTSLRLRIGVSVGDVVTRGDDLLGDGVNIAARLESVADPGGLAISADVLAQVRGKIDVPLEDFGYHRVKDTDAPIHIYKTGSGKSANRGLFDFPEDDVSGKLVTGGCLCGAIRFEISAPPISTGYCHCRLCQKFSGAPMSAWTAFPTAAVRFHGSEPRFFRSSPIAERGFCPDCGSSLAFRMVKPHPTAFLVLFTSSLDEPARFPPAAHSGIESQMPWLEILDDLPRTKCAESRVLQEAWASVGLPDPRNWDPGATEPEVF